MKFTKRNLALMLIIIPLIIIFSSYAYLFVKKDDATFYLKDIKGDRSALSDITITGVLQDRFHGQYFEIKNGMVSNRFKYYDNTNDIIEPTILRGNGISYKDLVYWFQRDYEIAADADTKIISVKKDTFGSPQDQGNYYDEYEIIEERTIVANKVELIVHIGVRDKDFKKHIEKDSFNINTGIVLEGNGFEYELTETVQILPDGTENQVNKERRITDAHAINNNTLLNCMTILEEKLYFTVPTTKKCSGENGIFVVDEFGTWWNELEKDGKGRKIVKLDLSEHNMDILGLEAVNNKLVLIMMVDNILTLRTYDKEGNFIDEKAFPDIDLNMDDESDYFIGYLSFINGNILNLSFNTTPYTSAQTKALLSVEIGDEIKEKHKIQNPDFVNEITRHYNIYTKDDKLYMVTSVQNINERDESAYDVLKPWHFIIMVYENSKLLYKGELITDADEDLEIERLKHHSGGYSYNMFDYRHFINIELR